MFSPNKPLSTFHQGSGGIWWTGPYRDYVRWWSLFVLVRTMIELAPGSSNADFSFSLSLSNGMSIPEFEQFWCHWLFRVTRWLSLIGICSWPVATANGWRYDCVDTYEELSLQLMLPRITMVVCLWLITLMASWTIWRSRLQVSSAWSRLRGGLSGRSARAVDFPINLYCSHTRRVRRRMYAMLRTRI